MFGRRYSVTQETHTQRASASNNMDEDQKHGVPMKLDTKRRMLSWLPSQGVLERQAKLTYGTVNKNGRRPWTGHGAPTVNEREETFWDDGKILQLAETAG